MLISWTFFEEQRYEREKQDWWRVRTLNLPMFEVQDTTSNTNPYYELLHDSRYKKLQEKGNEYTGNYELDGVYAYGREAMKSLTKIVISGLQWRKKKNAKGERVWKIWRKWKEVREWKDYRETYREVCKGKEVINEKHIRKRKLWNENYKWSRNEMKSLWVKENYRMRSL